MNHSARASAQELRSSVRDVTSQWRAAGRFEPRSDSWLRSPDVEFSRELAARGLIGMTWPQEYGGGEFSNIDRLAVTEELLRAGAPVAAHWIADRQIGPAILRCGTPELRREILPGIVNAESFFCLGMSEPEAGSDLAAVKTVATAVDGGWLLRGHKVWTTGAHFATHAYVLARTSPGERKHHGLSEFIMDMNSDGVLVSPIVDMAGEHHFNELVLDDVFVPHGRLLGEEGNGWRQVIEQLSFERGDRNACCRRTPCSSRSSPTAMSCENATAKRSWDSSSLDWLRYARWPSRSPPSWIAEWHRYRGPQR